MVKRFSDIHLEGVNQVIDEIFEFGEKHLIWTFEENLGAGKTTLSKGLADKLGIKDQVSSPTFNYVNDYDGKVYHFDCYRIKVAESFDGKVKLFRANQRVVSDNKFFIFDHTNILYNPQKYLL